ncbi:GNAT family N-acetyltransferase [Streptomyces sp. NPDC048590]|uniref:GNAT family N-acetyltransferase n=1 Tax=Streptomyces sp. NPDC048590 TaxID=3365574 RepID=UPI003714A648
MRIRSVDIDELPLLQDIERAAGECFREIGMPEVADDEPPSVGQLAGHLRRGLVRAAVDRADVPVAYLIAGQVDGALHVEQVSVHPGHARNGIGRALLDRATVHAEAEGLAALTLTTFGDVPWNAPYYRRIGFRTLDESEIGPGLGEIRRLESAHGLDRWPRVCMRREV